MKIRGAVAADAPAMGVMVDSFLSAHRGQIPRGLQQRVDEWTPDVTAEAGLAPSRAAEGKAARDVPLVAEDDAEPQRPGVGIGSRRRPIRLDRRDRCPLRPAGSARPGFRRVAPRRRPASWPTSAFSPPHRRPDREPPGPGVLRSDGDVRSANEQTTKRLLPVTVYGWSDITALSGVPAGPRDGVRRRLSRPRTCGGGG